MLVHYLFLFHMHRNQLAAIGMQNSHVFYDASYALDLCIPQGCLPILNAFLESTSTDSIHFRNSLHEVMHSPLNTCTESWQSWSVRHHFSTS